jgi:nucleoside-diphosphate kinase
MIKPDGVKRGLIGDIILRIERAGLKIIAIKMLQATEDQIKLHYPMSDESWIARLGEKGLSSFNDVDMDPLETLGSVDATKIGKSVANSLIEYMTSGPVVAIVVEGIQAIAMVRKLAGHTLPYKADVGTIRGDYSVDSPVIANVEGRAIHNIMHASENEKEAMNEIALWFPDEKIPTYRLGNESIMYN